MRFKRGIAVATSDKQNSRCAHHSSEKKASDLFVFRGRGNDQSQSDVLLGETQDIRNV